MRIGGGTGGGAMPWWLARRDREFGPDVRGMALSVSADRGLGCSGRISLDDVWLE